VKRYRFERWQNLIVIQAAIEGERQVRTVRLMVDTGSTHTVVPWQRLQNLGYDPAISRERRQIFTADSMIMVPRVRLRRFHCLDKVIENFPVLCHTVPFISYVDDLLGIDFLRSFDIAIHVRRGYIEVE
jgi:aspartyl protease family protein